MFCTPSKTVKARKLHQCTYCCEPINAGDSYLKWTSVDDSWFTNKLHAECLDALLEEADGYEFEYMPFSGERPKDTK